MTYLLGLIINIMLVKTKDLIYTYIKIRILKIVIKDNNKELKDSKVIF